MQMEIQTDDPWRSKRSMNQTLVKDAKPANAPPPKELPIPVTSPRRVRRWRLWLSRATASPLWWGIISCTILAISGGSRTWRDWKYETFAEANAKCPFPLEELPRELGTWRAVGSDTQLPDEIARLAGSSAHVMRQYQDDKTGAMVKVLVLYGVANSVFAHRPEICFTGAGFQAKGQPEDGSLKVQGSSDPVGYRMAYFTKTSGAIEQEVEVCHTFLHHKDWLPYLDSRWKLFRQYPAMCKIQIERIGTKPVIEKSPSLRLLAELVETINRRVADAEQAAQESTQKAADQAK
jgi:hypothetical protein